MFVYIVDKLFEWVGWLVFVGWGSGSVYIFGDRGVKMGIKIVVDCFGFGV